jgi:hypothetical protein
MTDAFTKYVELVAIPDKEATTVTSAIFHRWICRYGIPNELITDRGTEFANQVSKELYTLLDLKHTLTSARHPQCNSQAEVCNKTIAKYLASFVSENTLDWEIYLPPLMFAYNTSFHRSVKNTPHFLTYGMAPRTPFFDQEEIRKVHYGENSATEMFQRLQFARNQAQLNNEKATDAAKNYYDKSAKDHDFSVGQKVLLENYNFLNKNTKLARKFNGPFEITDLRGKHNAEIQLQNGKKVLVNVSRIKPYLQSSANDPIFAAKSEKHETTKTGSSETNDALWPRHDFRESPETHAQPSAQPPAMHALPAPTDFQTGGGDVEMREKDVETRKEDKTTHKTRENQNKNRNKTQNSAPPQHKHYTRSKANKNINNMTCECVCALGQNHPVDTEGCVCTCACNEVERQRRIKHHSSVNTKNVTNVTTPPEVKSKIKKLLKRLQGGRDPYKYSDYQRTITSFHDAATGTDGDETLHLGWDSDSDSDADIDEDSQDIDPTETTEETEVRDEETVTPEPEASDETPVDSPEIATRRATVLEDTLEQFVRNSDTLDDRPVEVRFRENVENLHLLADEREKELRAAKTTEAEIEIKRTYARASKVVGQLHDALSPKLTPETRQQIYREVNETFPPLPDVTQSPLAVKPMFREAQAAAKSRIPRPPQTRGRGGPLTPAEEDPESLLRRARQRQRQLQLQKDLARE